MLPVSQFFSRAKRGGSAGRGGAELGGEDTALSPARALEGDPPCPTCGARLGDPRGHTPAPLQSLQWLRQWDPCGGRGWKGWGGGTMGNGDMES